MVEKKIILPPTEAEKTGDNSGMFGRRPTVVFYEIGIPISVVSRHDLPKSFTIEKGMLIIDIEEK